MSEELKPCPFCGGEAKFKHTGSFTGYVQCKKCYAKTKALHAGHHITFKTATKYWNRRAGNEAQA